MVDTEALFFIHHQQAELVEHRALTQQLMRSHNGVDGAFLKTFKDRLPLAGGSEAIEQSHLDGIGRKTL
ncbi:MAG: Uncharacterised protein [Synechococcus sp. MIT S9220]|nr:MAG: Uncharacterised protein [Synechococcus sp. MIT S9220]